MSYQVQSRIIKGQSKKTGKSYTAYQIMVTDDHGNKFVSDYVFPKFQPCDADGNIINNRPYFAQEQGDENDTPSDYPSGLNG